MDQDSRESVIISDEEGNLVDNLNKILEDGDSQVSHTSQASRVSQVSEPPATHGTSADATVHSETDTMTLQDIL